MSRKTVIIIFALLLALCAPQAGAQEDAAGSADRIYVLGEVNDPGDFELKPGMNIKDALATAGGPTDRADRSGAVLIREGSDSVTIDIDKLLAGEIPDMELKGGDTLVLKPTSIRVLGEVNEPGVYDLTPGMSVLQALAAAGGAVEGADLEAAYVEREGKFVSVDLRSLLEGADMSGDISLQTGDVLHVPERTVTITGEVRNPGLYTLIPGQNDRLQDLMEAAGGPTDQANLAQVQITRIEGAERPRLIVDATQMDAENNPTLQQSDLVTVPPLAERERRSRVSISQVYQIVLILYYLRVILN